MAVELELPPSLYEDLLDKKYKKFAMPSKDPESSLYINCMSLSQIIFIRRFGNIFPPEFFHSQNLLANIHEFENVDLYNVQLGDIALLGPIGVTDFASLHQATFAALPMDNEPGLIHARGREPKIGVFTETLSEIQSHPFYQKIYAIKRASSIISSL
ncbi:MAG: hypothetical protein ACD_30C00022G0006 [uncultured bacterium]|uniref:Uncharacterized protein n=3 Tax=Candidatus Daviesiibacteriota TaxID=1752718 RepID=A0A0G0ERC8_9BACT|nr:MAG: hypothetical protein ACD_30C00022G0006 [uncultured bacterium]KKQ08062.1 MAG: hypothetical protein US19_C0032G0006 [Candidatus Daviesbacteria bacterium GW2011_GWB1_36_5]KKQ16258.1 MAG: hypothetical protein US28_C0003G0022 [Candidatus Daviesbacteria bacterium GW2011_GWA1_36_8]OGE33127.1 MAG: hypothetical protein A3C99_03820 [Candidatus Daviesbacteria bacterium RIFCSPHIGHO2_02_FULL_37_9]OGE36725.1 MAG: hypothetical protein A3E66_02220 [Candidatus Daviesbacteria bacterium RIFCSPHIGHO2_12_FU